MGKRAKRAKRRISVRLNGRKLLSVLHAVPRRNSIVNWGKSYASLLAFPIQSAVACCQRTGCGLDKRKNCTTGVSTAASLDNPPAQRDSGRGTDATKYGRIEEDLAKAGLSCGQ